MSALLMSYSLDVYYIRRGHCKDWK